MNDDGDAGGRDNSQIDGDADAAPDGRRPAPNVGSGLLAALGSSNHIKDLTARAFASSGSEAARAAMLTSGLRLTDTVVGRPNVASRELLLTSMVDAQGLSKSIYESLGATRLASSDLAGMSAIRKTIEQATRLQVSSLGLTESARTGMFKNLAGIRSLRSQQLASSAGLANILAKNSVTATWRQSILAASTAQALEGTMLVPGLQARLGDLVGINTATSTLVTRYAQQNASLMLRPAVSSSPTRELRQLLVRLPHEPTARDLALASNTSRTVAGITSADLLVSPGTVDLEAAEYVEDEVVDPWMSGPEAVRDALFVRLKALDPDVPEFLKAAWIQVTDNGPAAVSMAANAAIEAVDRTLRAAAPEQDVLAAAARGDLGKDATHSGRGKLAPTRRGRIAFIVGPDRHDDAVASAIYIDALAKVTRLLTDNLQGGKHASGSDITLIRSYLVGVEALLVQLFADDLP